uniref:Uncharacterized protein n=1 Tax=Schizaphis graminum TaxID=13262 RepID=A0A2S2NZH7_SCHGA
MVNPSKMLGIFIIFCYFIHYSHSDEYPKPVQDCINLMIEHKLIVETPIANSSMLSSIYVNWNFPIPESMLAELKAKILIEPLKTYIDNYSPKKLSGGAQEVPLAFCLRQEEKKNDSSCSSSSITV